MLKAWRGILRSIHRAALRLARGHRNPRRLAAAVAMSVVKEHRHLTYRELEAYVEEHPDLVGMCRMPSLKVMPARHVVHAGRGGPRVHAARADCHGRVPRGG